LEHAAAHHEALARGDALVVERRARGTLRLDGRSSMSTPLANTCSPRLSTRKLVLR